MENVSILLKESNTLFQRADHILYITYPLVKDNKLIVCILENLSNSLIKAMDAVLYYDLLYKRLEPFQDNFEAKFAIFKESCAERYNFNSKIVELIKELRKVVNERKKSKMEFIKQDKYVIYTREDALITITLIRLKEYLNISKDFLRMVNYILKNAR